MMMSMLTSTSHQLKVLSVAGLSCSSSSSSSLAAAVATVAADQYCWAQIAPVTPNTLVVVASSVLLLLSQQQLVADSTVSLVALTSSMQTGASAGPLEACGCRRPLWALQSHRAARMETQHGKPAPSLRLLLLPLSLADPLRLLCLSRISEPINGPLP